jgi:hypothetical protein
MAPLKPLLDRFVPYVIGIYEGNQSIHVQQRGHRVKFRIPAAPSRFGR